MEGNTNCGHEIVVKRFRQEPGEPTVGPYTVYLGTYCKKCGIRIAT